MLLLLCLLFSSTFLHQGVVAQDNTRDAPNVCLNDNEGVCITTESPSGVAWINEFHYDNKGDDENEFIEVAYTSDTDITSFKVVLYNGNGGAVYNSIDVPDGSSEGNINLSVLSGFEIQNGGPDGIALVDGSNKVVEFLSYEGTFMATNGPAEGLMSEDIGKVESGSTAIGLSLQRRGNGCKGSDFKWFDPAKASPGALGPWITIQGCEASPTPSTPDPEIVPPTPRKPLSTIDVKVMTYNIKDSGTKSNVWKDIVKGENPDIIVFTEVGSWWKDENKLLNDNLVDFNEEFSNTNSPYFGSTVQGITYSNSANAIMSRFPIVQEWQLTDKELSNNSAHDLMVWKLDVGSNKFVYVFGIHLKCCGSRKNDERRNETMKNLLEWIGDNTKAEDGVMLVGDFNCVSPVDTDEFFPGHQPGFKPSTGSNLNDGPMRMLLDDSNRTSSKFHTFKDAFREANPRCGSNPECCADNLCDSSLLNNNCPERGYTYVNKNNKYDSRIDFIVVNQGIDVTGDATSGYQVGELANKVCTASDHLAVVAILSF